MYSFSNLILAVKGLRDMFRTKIPDVTTKLENGVFTVSIDQPSAPLLKDCKEFVEACMVLGAKEYAKDPIAFCNRFGVDRNTLTLTWQNANNHAPASFNLDKFYFSPAHCEICGIQNQRLQYHRCSIHGKF